MNQSILITDIPEKIEISGLTINLRDRLKNYIRGTGQIDNNHVYVADVISWLNWEEVGSLKDYIDYSLLNKLIG
jgi:hypothetical protein